MANTQGFVASQTFRVGIIGAGMGGLTAAIALARAGAQVTLLEAAPELGEIGAGIQILPNVSRFLVRWGIDDIIGDNLVHVGEFNTFGPDGDGDLIAHAHGKQVSKESGFPWWVVRRDHLHTGLSESARRHGVKLIVNARVSKIDDSKPDIVKVETTQGATYEFNLLVGADGVKSVTRNHLFPSIEPQAVSNIAAYRGVLQHEEILRQVPEARLLLRENSVNLFIAPDGYILLYPLTAGREINVITAYVTPNRVTTLKEIPISSFRSFYTGFAPVVQKIVSLIHETKQWPLVVIPPLKTWSNTHKNIVLLGDAAHAMQNHMAQGAATSMEDGAFLGRVIDDALRGSISVKDAIGIYEQKRIAKSWTKQQSALCFGEMVMVTDKDLLALRDKSAQKEVLAVFKSSVNPKKEEEEGVYGPRGQGAWAGSRSWNMITSPNTVPGILNYDAEGHADSSVSEFLQEQAEREGTVDDCFVAESLRRRWWNFERGTRKGVDTELLKAAKL